MTGIFPRTYLPVLFLLAGLACISLSSHEPVRDFGNYYYGSKLLLDGKFSSEMYTSIHYFNQQIASYGETNFFENYIPVPPLSALFYAPLCIFKSLTAKLIFNCFSLLILCISLYRIQGFLNFRSWTLYLLPLVLFYPLYSNIVQGQAYLLISALLLEAFMASEKKQVYFASLLLALVISLKIFPVIILLYFLFKKNFKIIGLTLLFVLAFNLLTALFISMETLGYYYSQVLPRLLNNDVVGAYYIGNQSFYTALLNLFSYDRLANPHPVLTNFFLIVFFESLLSAFVLAVLFSLRKKNAPLVYGIILFSGMLLGRYSTSYSLFFFLPLCLALVSEKIKPVYLLLFLACILVTVTVPRINSLHLPFILNFARLCGFLLLFGLLVFVFKPRFDYKVFGGLFLLVIFFKYLSFPVKPADYFPVQNTKGILYDISLKQDSIILKSTMGEKDYSETYALNGSAAESADLSIRDNVLYYKNKVICQTKDNKLKPFIYKGNSVVFMSDLNQGVRFYTLRSVPL